MRKHHLTWDKERHSIGIASIDDQHREIVERVNQIADAVSHGEQSGTLLEMMDDLALLACDHFAMEERLMTEHGYPGLETHIREHLSLLQQIKNLRKALHRPNPTKAALVSAFLTDWADQHIMRSDREIGEFLSSKGIS